MPFLLLPRPVCFKSWGRDAVLVIDIQAFIILWVDFSLHRACFYWWRERRKYLHRWSTINLSSLLLLPLAVCSKRCYLGCRPIVVYDPMSWCSPPSNSDSNGGGNRISAAMIALEYGRPPHTLTSTLVWIFEELRKTCCLGCRSIGGCDPMSWFPHRRVLILMVEETHRISVLIIISM